MKTKEIDWKKRYDTLYFQFWILLAISMGGLLIFISAAIFYQSHYYEYNNKAVFYCELSNLNGEIINKLSPYLERYIDESIEVVGEVNKTLAHLLEVRLVGKRKIMYKPIPCPEAKCSGALANTSFCEAIKGIKEEVAK